MKNLIQRRLILLLLYCCVIISAKASEHCRIEEIHSITLMHNVLHQADPKKNLVIFDLDKTLINVDGNSVTLVDPESPEIITTLRKREVPIIGLTARSPGVCGPGELENKILTLQQLQIVGIEFWHPDTTDTLLDDDAPTIDTAEFFKQIIFCGGRNKGKVFSLWLEHLYGQNRDKYPQEVIFTDDMIENHHAMQTACKRIKIPRFIGFHMIDPVWSDED